MHSHVSSSEVLPQVSLDISVDERTAGDRPEKAQSPLLTNVASSSKPKDGERVGVLLLNLGGPESLEDVQPFLFNLFADPVSLSLLLLVLYLDLILCSKDLLHPLIISVFWCILVLGERDREDIGSLYFACMMK
jgi:hypothetical protein